MSVRPASCVCGWASTAPRWVAALRHARPRAWRVADRARTAARWWLRSGLGCKWAGVRGTGVRGSVVGRRPAHCHCADVQQVHSTGPQARCMGWHMGVGAHIDTRTRTCTHTCSCAHTHTHTRTRNCTRICAHTWACACAAQVFTLEDIGRKYSVTRERVRQVEAKAMHKLQERAGAGSLSVNDYDAGHQVGWVRVWGFELSRNRCSRGQIDPKERDGTGVLRCGRGRGVRGCGWAWGVGVVGGVGEGCRSAGRTGERSPGAAGDGQTCRLRAHPLECRR